MSSTPVRTACEADFSTFCVLDCIRMTASSNLIFFFKQKTAYEIGVRLVGSEMCIRDSVAAVLVEAYRGERLLSRRASLHALQWLA